MNLKSKLELCVNVKCTLYLKNGKMKAGTVRAILPDNKIEFIDNKYLPTSNINIDMIEIMRFSDIKNVKSDIDYNI